MNLYPRELISQQAYPELDERIVSSHYFIRGTEVDIYPFLEKYKPLELIDKILPNTTKRDIFVFSVLLFGYFDEEHISLKVSNKSLNQYWNRTMPDLSEEQIPYSSEQRYPLFLSAQKLYEYSFSFREEKYFLSFWHKPTIANYWHFQLFTRDSNGQHLPREPKQGNKETNDESKKLKRLAVTVLEYVISESICKGSEAKKFFFQPM